MTPRPSKPGSVDRGPVPGAARERRLPSSSDETDAGIGDPDRVDARDLRRALEQRDRPRRRAGRRSR